MKLQFFYIDDLCKVIQTIIKNHPEEKIYNVGGYWNYEGNRSISTVNNNGNEIKYDFWKVNYHNIDFNKLTKIEK